MTNITSDNINYELFLSITTDVKYQYIYMYISLWFGNMIAIDQSFISWYLFVPIYYLVIW